MPVAQMVGVGEEDSAVHFHQLLWKQSFQGPLCIKIKILLQYSGFLIKTRPEFQQA